MLHLLLSGNSCMHTATNSLVPFDLVPESLLEILGENVSKEPFLSIFTPMGSTQLIDVGELQVVGQGGEVARRQIPDVFVIGSSTASVDKVPIRFLDIGSQFSGPEHLPGSNGDGEEIPLEGQPHPGNLPNDSGIRQFFDATIRATDLTTTIPRTARPLPSVISDLGDRLYRNQTQVDEDEYDRSPGELYKKLDDATQDVPGSSGPESFIPNPDIMKLINPDSIIRSLKRSPNPWRTGRRLDSSPAKPRRSDFLEVPIKEQLQEPFAKAKDCARGIMDAEGMANEICGIGQIAHMSKSSTEETSTTYYQRIFAILVLLEQPLRIRRFLKEKVSDGDLPLTLHQGKMYRRKDKENKSPLSCFDGWSSLLKRNFEKTQWKVNAPYLSRSPNREKPVFHFIVPPEAILPITAKQMIGEGAHGEVFKVRFSAGHQGFSPDRDKYFALKKLRKRTRQALAAEAMIPKLLSSSTHPNIMPLLATLEQNGDYYLLFDWAERDLSSYWLEDKPEGTVGSIKKTVIWMARECAGIADGLSRIHGPHEIRTDDSIQRLVGSLPHADSFKDQIIAECKQILQSQSTNTNPGQAETVFQLYPRHGDIKAQNVLLSRSSRGEMEEKKGRDPDYAIGISDFGLAGFGPIDNPRVRSTPAYAPPETETQPIIHGNSCDIWALGCLYLEFITWHFGGKELLEEFVAVRGGDGRFFEIFMATDTTADNTEPRRVAMVKGAVEEFIKKLRHHKRCSQFFSDFLDLIQQGMLIVEDGTLDTDNRGRRQGGGVNAQRQRLKCCEICKKLQRMYEKCLESEDYAVKSLN